MTKSVSTQWAIRVTTDQIHKCEDAFKKYSFIGYVREIGSETEKAHYHIAIQFDEPKDDNSVRYAVKKALPSERQQVILYQDMGWSSQIRCLFLQKGVSRSSSCHDWLI